MNTNPLRIIQAGPATYILEERVPYRRFLWWTWGTWKPIRKQQLVEGTYTFLEWVTREFPTKEAAEAWAQQLRQQEPPAPNCYPKVVREYPAVDTRGSYSRYSTGPG